MYLLMGIWTNYFLLYSHHFSNAIYLLLYGVVSSQSPLWRLRLTFLSMAILCVLWQNADKRYHVSWLCKLHLTTCLMILPVLQALHVHRLTFWSILGLYPFWLFYLDARTSWLTGLPIRASTSSLLMITVNRSSTVGGLSNSNSMARSANLKHISMRR